MKPAIINKDLKGNIDHVNNLINNLPSQPKKEQALVRPVSAKYLVPNNKYQGNNDMAYNPVNANHLKPMPQPVIKSNNYPPYNDVKPPVTPVNNNKNIAR
jgi:hypothetical protein